MRLPNGEILMHGPVPYDPVKAHEYYLRTRKLKGRTPGSGQDQSQQIRRGSTFTVTVGGKSVRLTEKQLKEQQAYAAKRVASIKNRLNVLNTKLRAQMREAKKQESASKKPPSAADKAKAARESKKYRDKHQLSIATKAKRTSGGSLNKSGGKSDPQKILMTQIQDVRKNLVAAVARQRALATATKNG